MHRTRSEGSIGMAAVSTLFFGASDCVLWSLRDSSGSETVDFDTNVADSRWVVQVQILCAKSRTSEDGSKSAQNRQIVMGLTKSGWLAKARVFCYFFLYLQ